MLNKLKKTKYLLFLIILLGIFSSGPANAADINWSLVGNGGSAEFSSWGEHKDIYGTFDMINDNDLSTRVGVGGDGGWLGYWIGYSAVVNFSSPRNITNIKYVREAVRMSSLLGGTEKVQIFISGSWVQVYSGTASGGYSTKDVLGDWNNVEAVKVFVDFIGENGYRNMPNSAQGRNYHYLYELEAWGPELIVSPTVVTNSATNIGENLATLNGNVTSDGGASITNRGFQWGTSSGSYPNNISAGTGTGNFNYNLSSLSSGATYYYRTYATNSVGTSYGLEKTFTTEITPCQSHNVAGFAWSSNIGWISTNCNDKGSAIDYGVDINAITGAMSGYAWSSNIGWIDFSGGTVDMLTGNLSGWAQALSPVGQPLEISGGWDGKISLTGVTINSSFTPSEFEGYAWGSEVMGWISFNCSDEGVCGSSDHKVLSDISFNSTPTVTGGIRDTSGDPGLNCFAANPRIWLDWEFNDPGDTQTAYQINYISLPMPPAVNFDSKKVISASNSYAPTLEYDTEYVWTVRVWDSQDASSEFMTPQQFRTPSRSPMPDFSWDPEEPFAEQDVTFTNTSNYCTGCSYSWDFNDGSPISSTTNPIHVFNNQGDYDVNLTASNDVGICSSSDTVSIGESLPLPTWRETKPF